MREHQPSNDNHKLIYKVNSMKRKYLKPAMQVVGLMQQGCLLAGSKGQVSGLGGNAMDFFNFDGEEIEDTDVDR